MRKLEKGQVFPDGGELLGMIARTGWQLYDMTVLPEGKPEWDVINKMRPVTTLTCGHQYLYVPTQQDGETPRDAYARKVGVGPSMRIVDADSPRWLALEVHHPSRIAVFSRLIVDDECIALMSPENSGMNDFVAIELDQAVEVFQNYFGIVETLADYEQGLQRPLHNFPVAA